MKKKTSVSRQKKRPAKRVVTQNASTPLARVSGFLGSPWGLAIVLSILVIGVWAVLSSRAATSVLCGKNVTNYTYKVPFGNAVWNQPVCGLPKDPRSADLAERFYKWSNANDGSINGQKNWGKIRLGTQFPEPTLTDPEGLSGLFDTNVYNAKDATMQMRVQTTSTPSNLDGIKSEDGPAPDRFKYLPDTTIPWNPNWKTGTGGDNQIVVLDEQNGRIYELWGYKRDLQAILQGCFFTDRLCTYTTNVGRDYKGNLIDYRTFEGPLDRRGVGLSMYATLLTPEEIAAGEIRHALGVGVPNTATGPVCTPAQLGTSAEGKTCGTALAPASKFEWQGANSSRERGNMAPNLQDFYTQDKLIPEGTRFALDIDEAYIENWIKSKPDLVANPRKAETARIIARALRDYGFLIVDTGGAIADMQASGVVNPDSRQKWANLGIKSNADTNLLDGLVKQEKLYVVKPPTLTCEDGSQTTYFCRWVKAQYPASVQTTPTSTIVPTPSSTPSPSPTTTATVVPTSSPTPGAKTSPSPSTSPQPSPDTTPPTAPVKITKQLQINPGRVAYDLLLRWSQSTDSGSGLQDYLITRNDGKRWNTASPSFADSTVVANVEYSYKIQARDKAGNVSQPATVTATGRCLLIWCWLE